MTEGIETKFLTDTRSRQIIEGIMRTEAVRFYYSDLKTRLKIREGLHITARLLGPRIEDYNDYVEMFRKEVERLGRQDEDRMH